MLVEILRIVESTTASRALASGIRCVSRKLLGAVDAARCLLSAIWRSLLNGVDGSEMSFEDVRTIERFLCRRSRTWAETTHHRTFVVSQGMSIFVVFSGKAFDVVVTCLDGAFLWSFILVRKHVRLQVLEDFAALRIRALSLLFCFLAAEVAILAAI